MEQALRALCDPEGRLELPDFVKTALYHPQLGYYTRSRPRVGKTRENDFYTATTFRVAFQRIVLEAALSELAATGFAPEETEWVEIGAEPDAALLGDISTPFKSVRSIRAGEKIELSGQLAVFSNELFDAQAFRQLCFLDGQWTERQLQLIDAELSWTTRPSLSDEAKDHLPHLPARAVTGYTLDLPTGAQSLAREIVRQDWTGLFVAFDYGKTWQGLIEDTPQGSARAYCHHQQSADILAQPGSQDITHHICWDHLEATLREHGFTKLSLQSQEAFIAHRAPRFLAEAFDPSQNALSNLRGQLKQLMHPALMGQKFQALTATRSARADSKGLKAPLENI